jgi:hypothetical protein
MHTFSPESIPHSWVAAFREGLKETGYVEGQNVRVDWMLCRGLGRLARHDFNRT